jgi:spermidine synthase
MGGGSFSMPKYIKFRHPNVEVDVAEIDPDVVKAAEEFLELSGDFNILIGDARRILKDSLNQYDLIMNDAFHGVRKIPFHLVTQEFNRLISQRLSSKGIYAINVRGRNLESRLVTSVIRTLKQDFRYVNHFPASEEDSDNNWILASHLPIPFGNSVLSEAETGMVLTDNHAPVEFLIASDFVREATSECN